MSAEGKKIAVGVFCADWRLHQDTVHLNQAARDHLKVDGVDVLAVAGPDGITKPGREAEAEALAKNIQVLIGAHQPVAVAFIGHYSCAGNPVANDEHDKDVVTTAMKLKEMLNFDGEIVALMATYTSDIEWPLKEIARI